MGAGQSLASVHGPGQTHWLGSAHVQTVPGGGGQAAASVQGWGVQLPSGQGKLMGGAGQSAGSAQSSGTHVSGEVVQEAGQ